MAGINAEIKMNTPWVLLLRHSDFYTTGMYIEHALHKICNVISIYLDKFNLMSVLPSLLSMRTFDKYIFMKTKAIRPDLILVIDPLWKKFDFSHFNAPTVYYAIDNHTAFHHHIKDARVQNYDFVFVAQKDYIQKYKEHGCENVYWLPLGCDPEIHKRYNLPLVYDLCFVGSVDPKTLRGQLISQLQRDFNMFVGCKYLYDMAKVYSQSRIVLNKSLMGDLNMRVFEALSCGRLLLTDRIRNGLDELFIDRRHLVFYENPKDLVEKARYYLDSQEEREEIAHCGQKEVHQNHTYLHRVKYLINTTLS